MSAERPAPNPTSVESPATTRPARRTHARKIAIAAAVAIAAGGYYYWQRTTADGDADRPLMATAAYGDVENTVASAGNLQPSNTVPVGAQVSGQLRKVHVRVGDQVTVGQLLGEIDARVQVNRVASSEANIASAEAQLEARRSALDLAKSNAERAERLMAERATSQQEYDSAMNNLASAEASYFAQLKSIEQNKATLATDKTQLEYTNLFAPIDGTVVSIAVKEGTTLNATQQSPTVMSIANLSTMTVETQISEADVGKLWIGMDVYFNTLSGGNRRWYSTLRQILPTPTATNNVVTYTGLFDVENDDGALLSGMTTQVYFVTSSARGVLTVPVGALLFADAARGAGAAMARTGAAGSMPPGGPATAPAQGERRERAGTPRDSGGSPGAGEISFPRRSDGPSGSAPGGFNVPRNGAAARQAQMPRQAKVRVVNADGSITEREVTVGVMSRVTAEVIAGLTEGEQVVAGIVQAAAETNPSGNQNNNQGVFVIPGGGFPGGNFPGGFNNNPRGR
jgi:membrane fusion protein, macrolide-specific efflux system